MSELWVKIGLIPVFFTRAEAKYLNLTIITIPKLSLTLNLFNYTISVRYNIDSNNSHI